MSQLPTHGKILVVEDEKPLREFISRNLSARSFHVFTASNGLEALAIFNTETLDLIILDVMMPHMHGFEVLSRLKAATETATIPVIMVTAKIQFENILEGYKAGADYYIPKPFTKGQLMEGIYRVLKVEEEHTPPDIPQESKQ